MHQIPPICWWNLLLFQHQGNIALQPFDPHTSTTHVACKSRCSRSALTSSLMPTMNSILPKAVPLPPQIWSSCYSHGHVMNTLSNIKYHWSSQTTLNNLQILNQINGNLGSSFCGRHWIRQHQFGLVWREDCGQWQYLGRFWLNCCSQSARALSSKTFLDQIFMLLKLEVHSVGY